MWPEAEMEIQAAALYLVLYQGLYRVLCSTGETLWASTAGARMGWDSKIINCRTTKTNIGSGGRLFMLNMIL